ncbi:MAG: hypothetical protein GC193_00700 [Cryomorphaceae bacterium]|nr:hypothetical protein [Cryomorphaceae bacterium]
MQIFRNIAAILIGLFVGSLVNGGIIGISGNIIPLPDGYDSTTIEGMKSTIHLLEAKHYTMPFLAHALGTFVGALLAALIAGTRKMTFALVIGGVFLIGGVYMVTVLPAPMWFNAADLLLAYIPMAYIGGKLVIRNK